MTADAESIEEWAWLAQAARGDDTAFRSIVERYQGRLLNYFMRAGAQSHAEDLVQESFLRLYRHRKRARPQARFTTYIHTLAHHVWIDHLRRQRRTLRLLDRLEHEPRIAPPVPPLTGARLDAERLLAGLSHEMRQTVVLVIYQGLTSEEAAVAMGIPTGTVKSRLFNALRQMRTALENRRSGAGHEP